MVMRRRDRSALMRRALVSVALVFVVVPAQAEDAAHAPVLAARIVLVNLPGAGAVSSVGHFRPGGPIHDKPGFVVYTQPGRILDPDRVLVTSSSNFGASKARANEAEGAVLSIDASGREVLNVPAGLA